MNDKNNPKKQEEVKNEMCECGKEGCVCEKGKCVCENGKQCECGKDGCVCEDGKCECTDDKKKDKDCNCGNEAEEYKNKYLRALADYTNLERRTYDQIEKSQMRARKNLLSKFIDILDTLYQAEVFVKDAGLVMVKDNFLKMLKSEGIEEMDLKGKEYDPYLAEAIDVVEDEKNDNKVIDVISRGYKLGDEIIRVAKVRVGKKTL
jgi:molecular chaperone GrpE